jgi:cysteinyl-tRNA synthetase
LLGYVERRDDATEVRTVQQIQHALGIGLNIGRELLGRMEVLESTIQRHFAAREESRSEEDRKWRLADRTRKALEHYAEAED